jgi:hypothetical protein
VSYATGDREYYDRSRDPFELDNIYGSLSPERRSALAEILKALQMCRGADECTSARTTG